jgi:hypothetical protein
MAILLSEQVAATLTHGADVFESLIGRLRDDLPNGTLFSSLALT